MIKAIVFDLDDTLYDQQQPFQQALDSVWNAPTVPSHVVADLFNTFKRLTDQVTHIETPNITHTAEALNQVLKQHALPALTPSVWTAFWAQYQQEMTHIDLFSEIRHHLSLLKDHYELGIITNGPAERQSEKALQLDLHHWFKRANMVISDEVGLKKPDARIFTYFNRMLNLQANEVVYIGDNFLTDMVGAKQAGWHAFWFNHRQLELPNQDYIPDQTVETPEELADLLQAMSVTTY